VNEATSTADITLVRVTIGHFAAKMGGKR
jgi:hypothetical protein